MAVPGSRRHWLFERVARDIETLLNENRHNPAFVLPSIRSLAFQMDVSYKTVWKAVQLCKQRGLNYHLTRP